MFFFKTSTIGKQFDNIECDVEGNQSPVGDIVNVKEDTSQTPEFCDSTNYTPTPSTSSSIVSISHSGHSGVHTNVIVEDEQ